MTRAVSSLLCGREEFWSELEKAMPCFFGLRTRVVSDRDEASPWVSDVLFVPSAGVAFSGPCTVLATCGSSPLASLSALLRKTLRRLVARKTGPLALSSIVTTELGRVPTIAVVVSRLVVLLRVVVVKSAGVGRARAPLVDST